MSGLRRLLSRLHWLLRRLLLRLFKVLSRRLFDGSRRHLSVPRRLLGHFRLQLVCNRRLLVRLFDALLLRLLVLLLLFDRLRLLGVHLGVHLVLHLLLLGSVRLGVIDSLRRDCLFNRLRLRPLVNPLRWCFVWRICLLFAHARRRLIKLLRLRMDKLRESEAWGGCWLQVRGRALIRCILQRVLQPRRP